MRAEQCHKLLSQVFEISLEYFYFRNEPECCLSVLTRKDLVLRARLARLVGPLLLVTFNVISRVAFCSQLQE